MDRLIEECISSKRAANLRPYYVKELNRVLRKFSSATGKAISELTVQDVEAWLGTFKTPGGRNTAISRLCALFTFAFRRGYIEINPMHRIDRARRDLPVPRILTPDEALGLMAATQARCPEMLGYVSLGLYAGIRPNELTRLDWSSVDVARGLVRIDAAASKVRRRRFVHLEPLALHWVKQCARLGPVAPKQIQRRRKRLCRKIGWPAWPHDILRHTAASYLLALHRDAGKVALMLGNSPGILLTHYHELVSPEDCARFWQI